MNALISVIIPVYNTAPWLARCLDSICTQTYQNLEILCVNDGSTDNSAEILAEYAAKDSRIRVFTQKNAGLAAARNTALEHASGKWVTGVDSDDYLAADALENAMDCVADGVDAVCMQIQLVSENGADLPNSSSYYELPVGDVCEMTPELAERLNVCFAGKLWNLDFVCRNGLRFPAGLVYEDNAFYCCAIPLMRKVAFCYQPGYYYMQRVGSIMGKPVTANTFVERNSAVYRYVAAEYHRLGLDPVQYSYFAAMFHCSYEGLSRCASGKDQGILREGFCRMAVELGLQRPGVRDYRLQRLSPQSRISRLFVQRYLNSAVVRFCKVPLWGVEYDNNGQFLRLRFLLVSSLIGAVRRLLGR